MSVLPEFQAKKRVRRVFKAISSMDKNNTEKHGYQSCATKKLTQKVTQSVGVIGPLPRFVCCPDGDRIIRRNVVQAAVTRRPPIPNLAIRNSSGPPDSFVNKVLNRESSRRQWSRSFSPSTFFPVAARLDPHMQLDQPESDIMLVEKFR